jgi:hypothetical protein
VKLFYRGGFTAVLVVGVVLVSSGFAVVSGTVAKPGGVCSKAGASVVSQGVSLVCKKSGSGKLVWRVAKASTSATIAPSTSATTTVAVSNVAPRVVSASAVTGNAVITIADMSPDTGVYAVQWVSAGQSFNSFSMFRTTTKTMTVPYLSCTRSYTLRVFVMQANWQLSDGFVNQNVTPHSATFDLTMPACSATTAAAVTTTTTVALTCATGGTCIVGNMGPGGGIVFYVHASGTFDCGATLASTCRYLEAAPTSGTAAWTDAEYVWSGNTTIEIPDAAAQGAAIGTGLKNTEAIKTQDNTADRAGTITRAYRGPNNLTDWHLPSQDELNELYNQRDTVGGSSDATYWSSSEYPPDIAWLQNFPDGSRTNNFKTAAHYVRPVRAFG